MYEQKTIRRLNLLRVSIFGILALVSAPWLSGQERTPRKISLTRTIEGKGSGHWSLSIQPGGNAHIRFQPDSRPSLENAKTNVGLVDFDFVASEVQKRLKRYEALPDEDKKTFLKSYSGREKLYIYIYWEGDSTADGCLVQDPALWNDLIKSVEPYLELHSGAVEFNSLWEGVQLEVSDSDPAGLGPSTYLASKEHANRSETQAQKMNRYGSQERDRKESVTDKPKAKGPASSPRQWYVGVAIALLAAIGFIYLRHRAG